MVPRTGCLAGQMMHGTQLKILRKLGASYITTLNRMPRNPKKPTVEKFTFQMDSEEALKVWATSGRNEGIWCNSLLKQSKLSRPWTLWSST